MNYLLEYLPDAYLQKIADYFLALRPPPAPQRLPTSARLCWRADVHWSEKAIKPGACRPAPDVTALD